MTRAKREAFLRGVKKGIFQNNIGKVYTSIKKTGISTLPQIQKELGISFNRFSGRITDLLDMGVIKEIRTNKYSMFKIVYSPELQQELADKREYERYVKWLKLGHKKGYIQKHLKEIKQMADMPQF